MSTKRHRARMIRHGRRWGRPLSREEHLALLIEAAEGGGLPRGFARWRILVGGPREETLAHVAARHGHLPPTFALWYLADNEGRTVAHEAALYRHLPPDFDRWELADHKGWTVAHVAAMHGLPLGFARWELADRRGWTVAHEAALFGTLPPGFKQWDLADNEGQTVKQIAALHGHLPVAPVEPDKPAASVEPYVLDPQPDDFWGGPIEPPPEKLPRRPLWARVAGHWRSPASAPDAFAPPPTMSRPDPSVPTVDAPPEAGPEFGPDLSHFSSRSDL